MFEIIRFKLVNSVYIFGIFRAEPDNKLNNKDFDAQSIFWDEEREDASLYGGRPDEDKEYTQVRLYFRLGLAVTY